jgi:hypothetical protein
LTRIVRVFRTERVGALPPVHLDPVNFTSMSPMPKHFQIAPILAAALGLFASLFLGSCQFSTAPGFIPTTPQISYASPACDTVGRAASHPVVSTGGSVSLYTVTPALPAGLTLDSSTGLIAGSPVGAQAPLDYTVIATGPQGNDTAVIRLWAVAPYSPTLVPSIVIESPVYDTVGKAATHTVYSLGGPVNAYTVTPALPAGLTLNTASGVISGTPTTVVALSDYRIVATGPGGKDTATLRLAVVVRPSQQSSSARPSIAYDSPVYDTVGKAAAHPVVSVGGKVTSYAVISVGGSDTSLPKGLSLNKVTGLISGTLQTPEVVFLLKQAKRADMIWPPSSGYYSIRSTSYILATGPGGKDTAAIDIDIAWPTGYPVDPGPDLSVSSINLSVHLSPRASTSRGILAKGSALSLRKMVVTLTSSVPTDAIIRDTILAGESGLMASSGIDMMVSKNFIVKPLRHWTVNVQTFDVQDSIVHKDSVIAKNLLAGETRSITLNIPARYDGYSVKLALPDSIGTTLGSFRHRIGFTRIRITVDGAVVRDTTKLAGYFAPSILHTVDYDYVRRASHTWKVEVFGDIDGWFDKPLFSGSILISEPLKSGESGEPSFYLAWMGPGSSSDPDCALPASECGMGGPIGPSPLVTIQNVSRVVVVGGNPNPLPKKR